MRATRERGTTEPRPLVHPLFARFARSEPAPRSTSVARSFGNFSLKRKCYGSPGRFLGMGIRLVLFLTQAPASDARFSPQTSPRRRPRPRPSQRRPPPRFIEASANGRGEGARTPATAIAPPGKQKERAPPLHFFLGARARLRSFLNLCAEICVFCFFRVARGVKRHQFSVAREGFEASPRRAVRGGGVLAHP